MIRRVVGAIDSRSGAAPFLRKALRYVFPDHWSFLLGEIALYAFVILVATGIYLTLFFEPSLKETVYHGSYAPLRGMEVSDAYRSVVDISFDVRAGLLIRQTHHWAADVFVAAIVLHLLRIFFTGAFRKPREGTYLVGLLMLMIVLPEGYLGYSIVDDLLSGMGLAIGYAVAESVPVIGGNLALLLWGGVFPGDAAFESRMYIAHVLIFPVVIAALLGLHLFLVSSRHHTQFARRGRDSERRVLGLPALPGYAPRSLALLCAVAAALFLLGGLVQINPIWQWGPYHVGQGTNGAQPDWYLGWLIGALRLVPHFDLVIGSYTLVPNPFWGGALFPLLVFIVLGAYPFWERRRSGDRAFHNVLDRPRDAPARTAFGAGFLTWVLVVFFAGSMDRAEVTFGISYQAQVWGYRAAVLVLPILVYVLVKRVCRELQKAEEIEALGSETSSQGTATRTQPG
ncbi:MAG: cytochrome bc complex cytochrome b subunit [Thermoleophilaceae bacterium]